MVVFSESVCLCAEERERELWRGSLELGALNLTGCINLTEERTLFNTHLNWMFNHISRYIGQSDLPCGTLLDCGSPNYVIFET